MKETTQPSHQFRDVDPPAHGVDRAARKGTPLAWVLLVVALFVAALVMHFVVGLPGGH